MVMGYTDRIGSDANNQAPSGSPCTHRGQLPHIGKACPPTR